MHSKAKDAERQLWEQWLHGYLTPYMLTPSKTRAEYVPYAQYKDRLKDAAKAASMSYDEIETMVDDVRAKRKTRKRMR
jgi:hypothetical protein